MRIERALTLRDKYARKVRDTYRESAQFKRTHVDHLAELARRVWDTVEYGKLPSWTRAYIQGVNSTCFDLLYSTAFDGGKPPLESVIVGPDGKLYREGDDTWLQEDTTYKKAMECHHAWRKAEDLSLWS